eukprot:SM000045S16242  [mRNA]  locus=s45:464532:467229:- [translate_table: standard]
MEGMLRWLAKGGRPTTEAAPVSASAPRRAEAARRGAGPPQDDGGDDGFWHWRSLASFHVERKIGSGKNSEVYSATCRRTGTWVVIKRYRKELMTVANHNQVRREVACMRKARHEHILRLYTSFEDDGSIYLVLEYAEGGDLYKRLATLHGGTMEESDVIQKVLRPLLSALKHLHDKCIVHRDIKPENLLVTNDGVLKLADFGFAISLKKEKAKSRLGTLDYMAPEVLKMPAREDADDADEPILDRSCRRGPCYDSKVDSWACGILAYELLVGKPPFEVPSKRATCHLIVSRDLPLGPDWPAHLSNGCISYLQKALCKDPKQRPAAAELLRHPWLRFPDEHACSMARAAAVLAPKAVDVPDGLFMHSPCSVLAQSRCDWSSISDHSHSSSAPSAASSRRQSSTVEAASVQAAPPCTEGKTAWASPWSLADLLSSALASLTLSTEPLCDLHTPPQGSGALADDGLLDERVRI